MAVIEQTSATTLKFLRNLFNEQTDELLIIKELIQNADDSGATRAVIGCSAGLPDADHPLLQGPALFAINDGPFRKEDASAIITLGLSTKGGEASTVGKFGLGLKSAFYLAEALFFMDARLDPADVWRKPHFDILSPWVQPDAPYRPDWVTFSAADRRRVLDHLSALGLPAGFTVWIPLRREADCRRPGDDRPAIIVRQYPGDRPFRIPDALQASLSRMLPMLANVTEISVKPEPACSSLRVFQQIGCGRLAQLSATSPFERDFSGHVLDSTVNGHAIYVGRETLAPRDDLMALSTGEYWPTTEVATAFGEEYHPDPSVPHGAVVWQRSPVDGQATWRATWSVFLPVENALNHEVTLPGTHDFTLTLHGYFFLRPDRKSIYGLHRQAADNVQSEEWVRERWNGVLAAEIILPRVLEGLADIVGGEDEATIEALTAGLKTSVLGSRHLPDLTSRHTWARVYQEGAFRWSLLSPEVVTLPFPVTDETVPYLTEFEALVAPALLRDAGRPALIAESLQTWPSAVFTALLARYTWDEVIGSRELLALFMALRPFLPVTDHRPTLLEGLRAALTARGLPTRGDRRGLVTALLDGYLGRLVLGLPEEGVSDALAARLLAADLSVLAVPHGFALKDKERRGHLCESDAQRILDAILDVGDVLPVLKFIKGHLDDEMFGPLVLERRLLPTNQGSGGAGQWLTPKDVFTLAERKLVFRQQREDTALLSHLRDVLGDTDLHFVPSSILNALDIDQTVVPTLSTKAVLATLRTAPMLGPEVHRLPLLKRLLEDTTSVTDATEDRAVLRLLLHGQTNRRMDLEQSIIVSSTPKSVWGHVATLAARHSPLGWTVVQRRVDFLSPRDMMRLKVVEAGPTTLGALLEAAASHFPGAELSEAERAEVIRDLPDDALLKRLPIFTTVDGTLTAIRAGVHLRGGVAGDSLVGQLLLLNPPDDRRALDRVRVLAPPLRHSDIWELALNEPEPWRHWEVLSTALQKLEGTPKRSTELPWWPLKEGGGVAPKDVLMFPKQDSREAIRQVRDASGLRQVVQQDLSEAFNRAFPAALTRLLASEDTQLERLGKLLLAARSYHIGVMDTDASTWMQACEGIPHGELPLLALLDTLKNAPTVQEHAFAAATRPMNPERLLWMLERLHGQVTQRGQEIRAAVETIYPLLLANVRLQGIDRQELSRLHFRSQAGHWRKAEDLVPFGPQFAPSSVLDQEQAEALFGAEGRAAELPVADAPARQAAGSTALLLSNGAQDLRRHIEEWERTSVPREQLGAFLGLLDGNPSLHTAAQVYLVTFNLGVLREQAFRDVPTANLPRAFPSYQALNDQIRLLITLSRGTVTQATNLLGEPLDVAYKEDGRLTSLFTRDAARPPFRDGETYVYPVTFKVIDLQSSAINYADLLFRSLQWVLHSCCPIPLPHLHDEFNRVIDSSQATVAATQNLLIKSAAALWGRQLGVQPGSAIHTLLKDIEIADRNVEQARERNAHEAQRKSERLLHEHRVQLKLHIEEDAESQATLLGGVRRKIEDMQYLPDSVPFELLQNADDALSEWEEMTGGRAEERGTFHADLSGDTLRFVHLGRPINYYSTGGIGEFDGQRRGFDADLEKMLTLLSSDKGEPSTGKFGLGFKSVFLTSDEPTIKSARLAFTVKGGVYPVTPSEGHVQEMRAYLERLVPDDAQVATLIELPLRRGAAIRSSLSRFLSLGPVSLAFTRSLKELHVRTSEGSRHYRWHDTALTGRVCRRVLRGGAQEWAALSLSGPSFTLLLPVTATGFGLPDPNLPTLWVTAPTGEHSGVPFLLNARFPVDTGRAQLARNAAELERVVAAVRPELHAAFEDLLTRNDPGAVGATLGWSAADVTLPVALWDALGPPLVREDNHPTMQLLRALFWGAEGAYAANVQQFPLIPNGLPGEHAALLRAGDPALRVLGFSPSLLDDLNRSVAFRTAYPAKQLLAQDTARAMTRLSLPVPDRHLTLIEALRTVLPDRQVSPGQMSWVAPLVQAALAQGDVDLTTWCQSLTFLTVAGTYAAAHTLVSPGHDLGLYGFAPTAAQLASDDETGLALFSALGGDSITGSEEIVRWLLQARGEARRGALAFIADQPSSSVILALLRPRLTGKWLESRQVTTLPEWETLDDDTKDDVLHALKLKEVTRPSVPSGSAAPGSATPAPQDIPDDESSNLVTALPQDFLQRILTWWSAEGAQELHRYNERLYPNGTPFVTAGPPDLEVPAQRQAWLALLMLGSLQSMGRTSPETHRNFLNLCRSQGWLGIFSTRGAADERWMGSIREYLQSSPELLKYFQSMRGYVGFYQLGHWLDEYVEVLQQMQYGSGLSLRTLLAPGVNPDLQGSGLDAPPLTRTLGMGAPFVLRELLRHRVLTNEKLAPLCYMPTRRVRLLMNRLPGVRVPDEDVEQGSRMIHAQFAKTLGEREATFGGQYDLPLHVLLGSGQDDAVALNLQQRLFGTRLFRGNA